MIKSIANFISLIASAIGGFFSWKSSPVNQRREAEKDLKKEEAEKAKLKAELSDAIHTGNDDKLNDFSYM